MNRHLIAAAFSASVAVGTAGLSLAANSLKAHDQDKYGVSKKTNLGGSGGGDDKGEGRETKERDSEERGHDTHKHAQKAKREKGRERDDEPGSPGSPTYINNYYVDRARVLPNRREEDARCSYCEQEDGEDGEAVSVGGGGACTAAHPSLLLTAADGETSEHDEKVRPLGALSRGGCG